MKNCPSCNSISSDSEDSCGVCGGNLSRAASGSLEQLVHRERETRPKKKLNRVGLALIIGALAMTGAGAFLLVLLNGFGLILLIGGLVLTLYMAGGVGVGMGGGRRRILGISMFERKVRETEEKRKRLTGEED